MQSKIISGPVREVSRFYADERLKAPRSKRRKGTTSLSKADANFRNATKRLARAINCNFREGDLWLTLSYDDENLKDPKEAAAEVGLFLRRVKRGYKKLNGNDLKYICSTSKTNPKTGEAARIHHHLVMDRMGYDFLSSQWKCGGIEYKTLHRQKDYTAVAIYIVRNGTREPDGKKWSGSHNLKKPVITVEPVKSRGDFRVPPGAVVCERKIHEGDIVRAEYVRYVMPEKKKAGEENENTAGSGFADDHDRSERGGRGRKPRLSS